MTHSPVLPDTLAQRIQHLREQLDMTQRQLARRAIVDESLIQDLESGVERFLAPAVRQKLARALRIKPHVLEEVEHRPSQTSRLSESAQWRQEQATRQLLEQVAAHPERSYQCPLCQAPLLVRQFDRLDLEDNPLVTLKVDCTQCLFRWSTD